MKQERWVRALWVSVFVLTAGTCRGQALPKSPSPSDTSIRADGTIAIPLRLTPPVLPEDQWAKRNHGVIGQFLTAPRPLDPINPFAKPEAGFGEVNLNKDTVNGRVMGLNLIVFKF